MALPNLIAIVALSKVVVAETTTYFDDLNGAKRIAIQSEEVVNE